MRGLARTLLVAAAAALTACSDSLVDHAAGEEVLHPSPCFPGEVLCGTACVAEDATHCGASCASCAGTPAPDPNAGPICTEAHVCGFACNPGWLRVGAACERAVAVTGGFAHSCAITTSGAVRCWGANDHGQLGDGTTQDRGVPVAVALPGPATAVAAGYVHTCALVGGTPWCWGANATGALGDGTTTDRASPVQVALSGAVALAAGGGEAGSNSFYGHTCARAGGSLFCWGNNDQGQLGDGSQTQRNVPVSVGSLAGSATAITAGERHSCGVIQGDTACWGAGASWQLGTGGTRSETTPKTLSLPGTTAVAAGAAHSCAVVSGALLCWGANSAGQAAGGDRSSGVSVQRPTSVTLTGITPAAVTAGSAHTCVLGTAGSVTCFGANDVSQLGGPATPSGSIQVTLPRPATAVAAGYAHSCAILDDGGLSCWGANGRGQLGLGGPTSPVAVPTSVSGR